MAVAGAGATFSVRLVALAFSPAEGNQQGPSDGGFNACDMRQDEAMSEDDDARFQQAGYAMRRLVSQCTAHVRTAGAKLPERMTKAPPATDYATDYAAALSGTHDIAYGHRLKQVESSCNALLSHLEGLRGLVHLETLHTLPAITIARSIAELSASSCWLLRSGLSADERAARAYAALFRSFDSNRASFDDSSRQFRSRLIAQLEESHVRVTMALDKKNRPTDEVAQVFVGRSHAKTRFNYSQRITEEIPSMGTLYSGLSGVAHGEHLHVSTSWATPDTYVRLIGIVAYRSIEAWSRSLHAWVGVTAAPFLNPNDVEDLIQSIPADLIAEFDAEAASAP
ncbi:hypothetical protein [Microbacterium phyllosphaerae]|uniref:hypothetical protein n=1 Tax=Microbacterium phyllosphaerae TaxID=124798 RepID=UPI003D64BFA1